MGTEVKECLPGGWGEGRVGSYSMGIEFQFHKVKSSGDLFHNNVDIVNTTKPYT